MVACLPLIILTFFWGSWYQILQLVIFHFLCISLFLKTGSTSSLPNFLINFIIFSVLWVYLNNVFLGCIFYFLFIYFFYHGPLRCYFFMLHHAPYQRVIMIISWFSRFQFLYLIFHQLGFIVVWNQPSLTFLIQYYDNFFYHLPCHLTKLLPQKKLVFLGACAPVFAASFVHVFTPAFTPVFAPVSLYLLFRLIISTLTIWSSWYFYRASSYRHFSAL